MLGVNRELADKSQEHFANGEFDQALAGFQTLFEKGFRTGRMYGDLSACHYHLGNHQDGIEAAENAIVQEPEDARAHMLLGMYLLRLGQFERGWREYHWVRENLEHVKRLPAHMEWKGESLEGKNILVVDEQGFGDTFQFCRFLPALRHIANNVVVDYKEAIVTLMQANPQLGEVHDKSAALSIHCWTHMSAIPYRLGLGLSELNVLGQRYLNRAPGALPNCLTGRTPGTFRIGLMWIGSDREAKRRSDRSLPVALLKPLIETGRKAGTAVKFYHLHNVEASQEIDEAGFTEDITELAPFMADFADLSRIVDEMDLVISIDTGVAHLSAAMGKPTWCLLPKHADWRWWHAGPSTPWYPLAKLFRQSTMGEWGTVVEEATDLLSATLQRYQ